ncbi:EamA family transporter [Azorhizobium caulinodans]|uniref:Uncharacterized protein n=1 Tax=Azorhizobium caulinodans (strain ATCC 43989 / DSM 5975 / JCM 20966 / LMG 6465 / NBRC 14845 / NCIMB 13405 / ORS 571) TaxID=438753 RepID=A8I3S9_AZOC5|nr:EamA family transporter [Azorhizobium caulinodans]BAF87648.1 hypothetical protein AZC_1650 [Azorhizobium caulinodans ORS 571]
MMHLPLRMGPLALVGVFLGADTATQLAFKAAALELGDRPLGLAFLADAVQAPYVWAAIACYLATYVLWIAILQGSDLARAFPLTALSYVTVPLGGWFLFGEGLGLKPALGIALICAGVTLIGHEEGESLEAQHHGETPACVD